MAILYARVARSDIVISPFVLDRGLQGKVFAAQYLFIPAHVVDTTLVTWLDLIQEAQIESGQHRACHLKPIEGPVRSVPIQVNSIQLRDHEGLAMLHLYRWHMQSVYFGHCGLSGFHASQSHDVPLSPTGSSGRAAGWHHEDEGTTPCGGE